MSGFLAHLPVLPILVPLAGAAIMLFFDERRRRLKARINLATTIVLALVSLALLVETAVDPDTAQVYRLGDWPAPFAIVLVADPLASLMVMLTSLLALASLTFSLARWHRSGAHFHSLFQILLMGLNGSFLTGDLFNLFVFFEIMLAASFGLLLHGSGAPRIRASLQYIAINLAASSLFLLGVSLIYGVTGTLNMADLSLRMAMVAPGDRTLLEAGAALLSVSFLVKAGMWPLCFWLPQAYSVASAPVAAIFVITSKVGIAVILRLSLLIFGQDASFGSEVLLAGGLATIAFGAIGVLASQAMGRIASFSVLVSSGTLLAAIGFSSPAVTAGALFYLVSSTLTICAFFLLIELVERGREPGADVFAVTAEAYGIDEPDEEEVLHESEEVGVAIPATIAFLGIGFFACALLIAGLPPLSGFVAKVAMLTAVLNPAGFGAESANAPVGAWGWSFVALLILSGLATLLAMLRTGIRIFWVPSEGSMVQRVRVIEYAPVVGLLALCVAMTAAGEPVMSFMRAAATAVHAPDAYVRGVLPDGSPAEPERANRNGTEAIR